MDERTGGPCRLHGRNCPVKPARNTRPVAGETLQAIDL